MVLPVPDCLHCPVSTPPALEAAEKKMLICTWTMRECAHGDGNEKLKMCHARDLTRMVEVRALELVEDDPSDAAVRAAMKP